MTKSFSLSICFTRTIAGSANTFVKRMSESVGESGSLLLLYLIQITKKRKKRGSLRKKRVNDKTVETRSMTNDCVPHQVLTWQWLLYNLCHSLPLPQSTFIKLVLRKMLTNIALRHISKQPLLMFRFVSTVLWKTDFDDFVEVPEVNML